jgi:hypothetical protein
MALSILDGNQTATTLSTILSGGQHITAHTVISLGTQAITDITSAVSGTSVCVGSISISGSPSVTGSVSVLNFPASQSTTFGAVTGSVSVLNFPASQSVTFGATTGSISVLNFPSSQAVTFSAVTISNFPATQQVSLATLPALVAGTAQIGSVTASISNSVVTFYPMQGTSVSNTNFTSTTASTTLVSAVANREVLTVFNEGAGNLHISPGATCTTVAYQVRLSSGDYWECPAGQLSLAHSAVFATAGTARVTQVS